MVDEIFWLMVEANWTWDERARLRLIASMMPYSLKR